MSESGCLPSVVVACEDRSGMGVVVVDVVGMRVPHTVVVGVGDEDIGLTRHEMPQRQSASSVRMIG